MLIAPTFAAAVDNSCRPNCPLPPGIICNSQNAEELGCTPGLGKPADKKSSSTMLIAAVGGVAFVGAMWYLFRAPKSSYFDGQVRFASF